jgi:hypothetical protein
MNIWRNILKLVFILLFIPLIGETKTSHVGIMFSDSLESTSSMFDDTTHTPTEILISGNKPNRQISSTNILHYSRFALVSGGVLGAGIAVHIYERNAWWKNWRRPFHVQEDFLYGKNVDKVGHVWGAAFCSFFLTKSYSWAGVSDESSAWIGAIGGSLFQLYVEFEDGYSQWGFDRVDAVADIVGGFYPLVQYYVPEFKNFKIKASYYPRQLGKQGNIPNQKHTVLDDYEGQTFWLSIKTGYLFPEIFPKFLNLSVGYSVRNLNNQSAQYGVLFVAPDVDFTEIFPNSSGFLKTVCETLDYYKFPTPAIQISPKLILFGLYY